MEEVEYVNGSSTESLTEYFSKGTDNNKQENRIEIQLEKVESLFENPSERDKLLFGSNLEQIEVSMGRVLRKVENTKLDNLNQKDLINMCFEIRSSSERLGFVQGIIYGFIDGMITNGKDLEDIKGHIETKFGLSKEQSRTEISKYYKHIGMKGK